jgi:hypothetical protein
MRQAALTEVPSLDLRSNGLLGDAAAKAPGALARGCQARSGEPHWRSVGLSAAESGRQPELEPYSIDNGGMDPGLKNPLGARALYIFQDGRDTLYRLHGTPEAWSIGKAVSSGCIRLLNQDVIDLYERVPDGTLIRVIQDMSIQATA